MPELSRNDFQRVAHRDGNIFFNQTTNQLDVRGGSFISRFVTWIKSKYNPNKVHQEYRMATESFIAEVKHAHNEVLRKYNGNYEAGTDDISRLYELGRQNKPLSARQVRQVLKNLDIAKGTLADTQAYLSPEQCNELLVKKMSKYPSLAINDASQKVDYTFGKTEIEKLNSRIQEAIIEEAYRKGGVVSKTTASAIAGKFIENHIGERVKNLLSASKYFNPEHCYTQVLAKLSDPKYHKLVKVYNQNLAERNRLTSNIQEAIIKAHFSSEQGITEGEASSIAHQAIAEYADAFIKTPGEQNTAPTKKPMSKSARQLFYQADSENIELSFEIKEQVRTGEISSLGQLRRMHNQSIAKRITNEVIEMWHNAKYLKTKGKAPQGMSDSVRIRTQEFIEKSTGFINRPQVKDFVMQAISDYLKRHNIS